MQILNKQPTPDLHIHLLPSVRQEKYYRPPPTAFVTGRDNNRMLSNYILFSTTTYNMARISESHHSVALMDVYSWVIFQFPNSSVEARALYSLDDILHLMEENTKDLFWDSGF